MTGLYFDIDDTLYSRKDLLIKAAQSACERKGLGRIDGEEFLRLFYGKSDVNFALVESGVITPLQSNIWRFTEAMKDMGISCPEGTAEDFADTYTYMQNHITLSPTLERMMTQLLPVTDYPQGDNSPLNPSATLCMGVLTNGSYDHQIKKYNMLGLERYIPKKYIVISGEVGTSKPGEGIFRAAEKAMGLKPDQIWLIGDSLKHDIEGARAAGWHTLWFDRSGHGIDLNCAPGTSNQLTSAAEELADLIVTSEDQMAETLKQLFL